MQETNELILLPEASESLSLAVVPKSIAAAGPAAHFAWEEFFLARVRNAYTRTSYLRAVRRFLAWTEEQGIELARITPGMAGHYFNQLPIGISSKKVHLAAVRTFFDVLVERHVVLINPAMSVRTERYSVTEGLTPEMTVEQARTLLTSIPLESLIDLRDRAVIGLLIYTAARAGAVAKLRIRDFSADGNQYVLRFSEKNGKARTIPCRHDVQGLLREYLFVAGLEGDNPTAPLFQTFRANGRLTGRPMSGIDLCRMVKRRLADAGLPSSITAHSIRSCTATDLLLQGAGLEDVQRLLGHSDSRTTALYDRRRKSITRNLVERISV